MSGEKETRVTVPSSYLRDMENQARRYSHVSRDLPRLLENVRRNCQREMDQSLSNMERRHNEQQQHLAQLNSSLRDLERESNRRLREQHQQFTRQMHELEQKQEQRLQTELRASERRQREYADQRVEEMRRQVDGQLQRQRAEYLDLAARQQVQIDQVNQRVDQVFAQAKVKQQKAAIFIRELAELVKREKADPDTERFVPGRLDPIMAKVASAANIIGDSEAPMPEAAYATAMDAYRDLEALRQQRAVEQRKYLAAHQAALRQARALLEEAKANREFNLAMDGEQGQAVPTKSAAPEEAYKVETDFWTDGAMSQQLEQLGKIEKELAEQRDTLTPDQLAAMEKRLAELEPVTMQLVDKAQREVISSNLRAEMSDLAAEAMVEQGFTLISGDFEKRDPRLGYVTLFKNLAGSEVVLCVDPDQESASGEQANRLRLNSYDVNVVNEDLLLRRAKVLNQGLREVGLDISEPGTVAQEPDPAMRQVDRIIARGRPAQARSAATASKSGKAL